MTTLGQNRRRPVLRARGVSKAFGATQALDRADLEIERGSIHALLGGNGSGKSTLIKLLAGVERADAGEVTIGEQTLELGQMTPVRAKAAGLHFVHQQRTTFPDLSVTENLAIGHGYETGRGKRINWRRAREHAASILERFRIDVHPDEALEDVGAATQTMIAIARALQDQDDAGNGVLLLDEPTASLPAPEVDLLLDSLRGYAEAGQSIVYVTHRLEEVFAVADRATLLKDGRVIDTVAPKGIHHNDLVEMMMGRSVAEIERLRGKSDGAVILNIKNLRAGPLKGVDLELCAGEIVGVGGLIGSGRSTLLRSLFGVRQAASGTVLIDGSERRIRRPLDAMEAGFAYVPEDRHKDAAFAELTVGENISMSVVPNYYRRGLLRPRRERRDTYDLFDRFLITAESDQAPLSSLSGGNQQKVVLARWLRRDPRVILLDEPTQGVDVSARAEIYELVHDAVAGGAAALIASSDFEELARVCDRVLILRKGEVIAELQEDELEPDSLARLANSEVAV